MTILKFSGEWDPKGQEDPGAAVCRLAYELRDRVGVDKLSFAQATIHVLAEHPALAEAHRDHFSVPPK